MRMLDNRGDTIVEVLIAIAVVSAVLTSAYGITNRSLVNTLQAQEHSTALKIAQAQLEQVRSQANEDKAGHGIFETGSPNPSFCFDSTNHLQKFVPASNYHVDCKDISTAQFRTKFQYDPTVHAFTIFVDWTGAAGKADSLQLVYGAYPS